MFFPFKSLPLKSNFQDEKFLDTLIDCLALIVFCDVEFNFEKDYRNLKLNGQQLFGIYYQKGTYDLVEDFAELLYNLNEKNISIPEGYIFLMLDSLASPPNHKLDPDKMTKVVTDILGDSHYMKFISNGKTKCIHPTSYIIKDSESLEDAKRLFKGEINCDE